MHDGVEQTEGEVGEIWFAGPQVARGYWGDADGTFQGRHEESTYLRTGDLGYLHEGELYVTGRLKETIILGGANHYPHDIEEVVIDSHPAFHGRNVAAFSVDRDPEEVVIVVAEIRGSDASQEDLTRAARSAVFSTLGIRVEQVILTRPGTITRTSSGKLQRMGVRGAYLEGKLA